MAYGKLGSEKPQWKEVWTFFLVVCDLMSSFST